MTSGTRLGPYEILAPIGAGGMGEVYRARDTKLNREVAIKVLPAAFAQDSERMARFQREAQTLAALNHPNIAQIFGMEESALVMEFVPGESPRGPMPVDEAMQIARQIGEALEAAHEKGIVHRDLKPANIKVTPEGKVKVLDFGLAKAVDSTSSADLSNSPTMSAAATQAGAILGTAAYMSPEQAKGKPVDARTDIWAYGCVLYELLTGKRAFHGETAMDTMAAVVRSEPDWSALPPGSPVELLRACLQKDVSKRPRHIGDSTLVAAPSTIIQAPTASPESPIRWQIAVAALSVALAAALFVVWRTTRPAPLRPMIRLDLEMGSGAELARVHNNGMLAISPDGMRVAVTYKGNDSKNRIGIRSVSQGQITPLAGTEDGTAPFFSPDGQWIGFQVEGKLKKVPAGGGATVTICESAFLRGVSWGDDGNVVFAPGSSSTLMRVSSDGGTPKPITQFKQGEITHRWPQVLPGSGAVLFTANSNVADYDNANVELVNLKTGERKTLLRGGFSPRYLPSVNPTRGHVVYVRENTLYAAPFDLTSLELTGPAVPIVEEVSSNGTGGGDYDFSRAGWFVYRSGLEGTRQPVSIYWLQNDGKKQALSAPAARYRTPRLSPDGKRLAYSLITTQGSEIWVMDLERNTPSRLSFVSGLCRYPVWTPDGRAIAYDCVSGDRIGLHWIRSDGSGEDVRLTDGKVVEIPWSVSPDGKRLAFSRTATNNKGIYTAPIEGDADHPRLGREELFLGTSLYGGADAAFSPDGRWMAHTSTESSGQGEVFVRPFPGPGGRWQISTGGARVPKWSRDGRTLLFQKFDGTIMAVSYTAKGDTFMPGIPRAWPGPRILVEGALPNYDLAPDGKRIVAFLTDEDAPGQPQPNSLKFLLNFFDELRRRAPGKN